MNLSSLVHIQGLKKVYAMGDQNVHALDGVNLEVPAGSFTVVMGPSGSGKSTLLYLIGGLDQPSEGEIRVDGSLLGQMDENDLAQYRRERVGFVFQSFNLVSSLDALENVSLPMVFNEVPQDERRTRAADLLAQVGLSDRGHHFPNQLSGGQQQRVAIARALVNHPSLVLCDEPTGNLDSESGLRVMELLSDLRETGCTLVVVTHDLRMKEYASQVTYLLDGRVVSEAVYAQKNRIIAPNFDE